ncbi:unnamed protein product, partial [Staurois parvus]
HKFAALMGTDEVAWIGSTDEVALVGIVLLRGGLTTHGAPPGSRGSWGPCVLAQTQKSL